MAHVTDLSTQQLYQRRAALYIHQAEYFRIHKHLYNTPTDLMEKYRSEIEVKIQEYTSEILARTMESKTPVNIEDFITKLMEQKNPPVSGHIKKPGKEAVKKVISEKQTWQPKIIFDVRQINFLTISDGSVS